MVWGRYLLIGYLDHFWLGYLGEAHPQTSICEEPCSADTSTEKPVSGRKNKVRKPCKAYIMKACWCSYKEPMDLQGLYDTYLETYVLKTVSVLLS